MITLAPIGLQDLAALDGDHVNEVLALLRENADICRRTAEMFGARAADERARGYWATFESCALMALRHARICQANEFAAIWFAAARFDAGQAHRQSVARQTVSVASACKLAGVTRNTLYNWIASGRVEFTRSQAGTLRIFIDTIFRQGTSAAPNKGNTP